MQSYVFATQIFYVFRVAREVDPYNRAGCNALNSRLSYLLLTEIPQTLDFLSHL